MNVHPLLQNYFLIYKLVLHNCFCGNQVCQESMKLHDSTNTIYIYILRVSGSVKDKEENAVGSCPEAGFFQRLSLCFGASNNLSSFTWNSIFPRK